MIMDKEGSSVIASNSHDNGKERYASDVQPNHDKEDVFPEQQLSNTPTNVHEERTGPNSPIGALRNESSDEEHFSDCPSETSDADTSKIPRDGQGKDSSSEGEEVNNTPAEKLAKVTLSVQNDELDHSQTGIKEITENVSNSKDGHGKDSSSEGEEVNDTPAEKLAKVTLSNQNDEQDHSQTDIKEIRENVSNLESKEPVHLNKGGSDGAEAVDVDTCNSGETDKNLEEILYSEAVEPVFDGTEIPGMEAHESSSPESLDHESEAQGPSWPEKAVALKNFVREKSAVAVSSVLRRLSGKSDDGLDVSEEEDKNRSNNNTSVDVSDYALESETQNSSEKNVERSGWNPLNLIGISRDAESKTEQKELVEQELLQPVAMKGRIILYTRLGCQDCQETRLFLQGRRLRYVEINVDVYPSRKLELEKIAGTSAVPRVFFNEVLIGGLTELKRLEESGQLAAKIEYVISEAPSFEAPMPPLSGEDDLSNSGAIDELAVLARKMKECITIKDRFYKMRRFTNCFQGSEAVDFLSEDQYLEREEAIEFGRKLASKLFFQHVLDENIFEDGNHLYRFLDDDPLVSQCQNIPRGITEVKPKPISEISSRLRFISYAIFEAYTSGDGKHVDYRSIHGSEEFARYLRTVEELQRVDLHDMMREEKLAFFVNLYNMMAIHAILVLGHPTGALERRRLFGDFKYVIGGNTYSLSSIHNGILRGNQRPPYNLIKPFGVKDKRSKIALPYPEPLVHFALVYGTRSGPSLRCYSPGNIDKELMEAAHEFLKSGGLVVDLNSKIASVSLILKWYSGDFGRNEMEVLKHAANYLEPTESQILLELLASTQLKVVYQPYDWGLNH